MVFPIRPHMEATWRAFGTPDEHKLLRSYPGGDAQIALSDVVREIADFLDVYMGPTP